MTGDRVSASVFVAAPPDIAFEVFTDQIDRWWRHGLKFRDGARGLSVLHLECKMGGRLFETFTTPGSDPSYFSVSFAVPNCVTLSAGSDRT